jgi:hypothetical protein
MSTMFVTAESIRIEADARREKLARDWQQPPRRERGSRRPARAVRRVVQRALHLPVRVGRHA